MKNNSQFCKSKSLTISVATLILSGCVTMDGAKDGVVSGLTTIRDNLNQVAGKLDEVNQKQKAEEAARRAEVRAKKGATIQSTKLFGLFEKYPIDGNKPEPSTNGELWFPRVALIPITVPSEHAAKSSWGKPNSRPSELPGITTMVQRIYDKPRNQEDICWTFQAKIWWSLTKSENVPEFVYCASDANEGSRVMLGGTPEASMIDNVWVRRTKHSSGEINTRGPKQPKNFAPLNFFAGRDSGYILDSYRSIVLNIMLKDMGLDPHSTAEANRVWVSNEKLKLKDF